MKISEHFTDVDVGFDLVAIKNKIDNTPSRQVLLLAEDLAVNLLEPLKAEHDFRIVSWYRCSNLEREYCKHSYFDYLRENRLTVSEKTWATYLGNKQHVTGSAVSLISGNMDTVFEWLSDQTFDVLQMRDGYIHVSYVKGANRKLILN